MLEPILSYLLLGVLICTLLVIIKVGRGRGGVSAESFLVSVPLWPFVVLYGLYLLIVKAVRWGLE